MSECQKKKNETPQRILNVDWFVKLKNLFWWLVHALCSAPS